MDIKPNNFTQKVLESTKISNELVKKIEKDILAPSRERIFKMCEIWSRVFGCVYEPALFDQFRTAMFKFLEDVTHQHAEVEERLVKDIKEYSAEMELFKRVLNENIVLPKFGSLPYYQHAQEMKRHVVVYREELTRRKEELAKMKKEADELKKDLGLAETKFDSLSDVVSKSELKRLQNYLEQLQNEGIVKKNKIEAYQMKVRELYEILSPVEGIDVEFFQREDLKPTEENENKLSSMLIMLDMVQEERNKFIASLLQHLDGPNGLWFRLHVPETHQRIVKSDLRLKLFTIEKLKAEVDRCREKETRRNQLPERIQVLREEIIEWLDKTKKFYEESIAFDVMEYQEEVLELHEFELDELKEYYEKNKMIFETLEERKSLRLQLEAMKYKQADVSARLKNRGGQLLKEEQERKSIEKQLLTAEAKLFKAVRQYEKEHTKPFMVEGKKIDVDSTAGRKLLRKQSTLTDLRLKKPLGNISNV